MGELSSKSYVIDDFIVHITKIPQGHVVPFPVTIPDGFKVKDSNLGLNTYRVNAIKKGAIEFNESNMVPFVRTKGESPQNSRVAVQGAYFLTGLEEDNEFVCITARQFKDRFYDYSVHVLSYGQQFEVMNSSLSRNLFLFSGELTIGEKTFVGFKHLSLNQPKDYVFTNTGQEEVFAIVVNEIDKSAAIGLAHLHFPNNMNDFSFVGEQ